MAEDDTPTVRSHEGIPNWQDYLVRVLLFLSSYTILFWLVGLMLWPSPAAWAFAALGLAGLAAFAALLAVGRRGSPDPYPITAVRDTGVDVAGYVVGYLLPFLVRPDPPVREVVAYAVFLAVVGVIYVRSDLVHVNPLLYLARYRVFAVTTGPHDRFLIARRPPVPGSVITASHMTDALLIERASGRRPTP